MAFSKASGASLGHGLRQHGAQKTRADDEGAHVGCQSGLRSLDPVPRFGVPKEGAAGGFVQFARTLLTADTTHPHAHDDDDNGFGATVSPLRSRLHPGVIKSAIVYRKKI